MHNRLLIKNAAELITCRGASPKCGAAMKELGMIHDGAIALEGGIISQVGPTAEVLSRIHESEYEIIDGTGKCVLPGFIDPHTHFVFAGYRAEEFAWRLSGATYMEIMERGGGIINTVQATRAASPLELKKLAIKRLDAMLAMGVTTVEGKSGYGLDLDTELKQLTVMKELQDEHPVEVVATFMGAHAIPAEYNGRSDKFVDFLITQVLPQVAERKLAEFCDVFCEQGVFSVEQSRKLLNEALKLGLKVKLHADEIVSFGGAELAAELGAVSADHLLHASDRGIAMMAANKVVATLLPATAFSLKENYARARSMIDGGLPVALATDFNPGSCYTQSIPLVIALATLYMGMSPAETVTALTINAAAAVGRAEVIGSLEVGKQGDVIILDAPSHLYLPYHLGVSLVETVVKKGHIVWRKKGGSAIAD